MPPSDITQDSCPLISIVITAWNRETIIQQCLQSVYEQDFQDYEIVLVDDASDDKTVEVARALRDGDRLRVVELPENAGMTAALAAGSRAARGRWHMKLDSDWYLKPGALSKIADMARQAEPDIGVVGACAKGDTGDQVWPGNPPPEEPFGFEGYLRWINGFGAVDYLQCRRSEVFDDEHFFPETRGQMTLLNMRVARDWRMWVSREILAVGMVNTPNSVLTGQGAGIQEKRLLMASDRADILADVLAEFGKDLRKFAPKRYFKYLTGASHFNYRAGRRAKGLRYGIRALGRRPWSLSTWAIVLFGLIGPNTMRRMGRSRVGRAFKDR